MSAPPEGYVAELAAAHDALQAGLGGAWNAAISLLREPDELERYVLCGIVAGFLRDARLHMRNEDDRVLSTARCAGVPTHVIDEFRDQHATLRALMSTVQPLLGHPDTVETAAVGVLRLVARFEQHLAHEESLLAPHTHPL